MYQRVVLMFNDNVQFRYQPPFEVGMSVCSHTCFDFLCRIDIGSTKIRSIEHRPSLRGIFFFGLNSNLGHVLFSISNPFDRWSDQ